MQTARVCDWVGLSLLLVLAACAVPHDHLVPEVSKCAVGIRHVGVAALPPKLVDMARDI